MQPSHSICEEEIPPLAQPCRRPDFFLLGAPKCGTTSVFRWLQAHPETYLPLKEENFFSRDVWDASHEPNAIRDWSDYLALLCPPDSAGKLTGDCSPRALYSENTLRWLSAQPTPPRLLILLRNPIDLVFSLHGQMVKEGVEREHDFELAWRRALAVPPGAERWRRNGRMDRRLDYSLFGRFGARLEQVFARLDPARIKVMILEEALTTDPAAAFDEITAHLGVVPLTHDLSIHNRRAAYRSPRLQATLNRGRGAAMRGLAAIGVRPRRGTGRPIRRPRPRQR